MLNTIQNVLKFLIIKFTLATDSSMKGLVIIVFQMIAEGKSCTFKLQILEI